MPVKIRTFAALAIALLVAFFCRPARAADDSLWVMTGFNSWHTNEGHWHNRQNNDGIGLSYEMPHDLNIVAGTYIDSNNNRSNYLGATYEPVDILGIHVGVLGGYVSGYSFAKIIPPVIPTASYEYRRVGINLIWVPTVVTAVQLKIRMADF
jgi:hypothetical protein